MQLKGEATYEPIVYLKQPYTFRGSISFGNKSISTDSELEDSTKIELDIFADVLNVAKLNYGKISDASNCPREILKFRPPPQNKFCDQNVHSDLTTIHDYGLNITFSNVSSISIPVREKEEFIKFFQFSKFSTESNVVGACIDTS